MTLSAWHRGCDNGLRWSAIALGFCIPVSVALDNLLLIVALACWLAGGRFVDKGSAIVRSPAAIAGLLLFAALGAGLFWGTRAPGDGLHFLGKYLDLAFIGVFVWAFRDAATRKHAIRALACSLAVTLILSIGLATGVMPETALLAGSAFTPSAFKLYLTHNLLMAYGALLFAHLAVAGGASPTMRRVFWCMSILACGNVLVMVPGRTGYLVLLALAIYFLTSRLGWRGLVASMLGGAVLTAGTYAGSDTFRSRIDRAGAEFTAWRPGAPVRPDDSVGLRLEFYANTLALIRERPWFGHGTGSFPAVYAARAGEAGMGRSSNPHNEYLLIGAQLGIAGLLLLVALMIHVWRCAGLAPLLERQLVRGFVLTIAVGSLFNSLLLDHTEGLLFAWMAALGCGARPSTA